jgi:hypothetical protein
VSGTLTLTGNVTLTNLRGIYVAGLNVAGNPLPANTALLTVSNSANIRFNNARRRLNSDTGADNTGPLIGTKVVVGNENSIANTNIDSAQMIVGTSVQIYNGAFYVPSSIRVNIDNTSNGFRGNSVFVAYKDSNSHININPDRRSNSPIGRIGDNAPQFYSSGTMRVHIQGSGAQLFGIYTSLGQFWNSGSSSSNGTAGFITGSPVDSMHKGSSNTYITGNAVNNLIDIGIIMELIVTGDASVLNRIDTTATRFIPGWTPPTFPTSNGSLDIREVN